MSGPVTHYFNNSATTNTSKYAESYNGSQMSYRQDRSREHNNLSGLDFQKLAENRSIYGSYLDNALAYDPYKEKKPMYDIVYTQDLYDPWGKPGGGAPLLDANTGRLKTKITGTMQWNLDGKTPSARTKKLMSTPVKAPPNLVEFRKTPNQIIKLPLNSEATTYRQVFGGIDNNNYLNVQLSNRQSPQSVITDPTFLEKQAEVREQKRKMQNQNENGINNSYFPDQNQNNNSARYYPNNNFNNSSNFNGNLTHSNDYMNYNPQQLQPKQNAKFVDTSPSLWTKMWFGRPGGGAPTYDARRKKLMEQLEYNNNSLSKTSLYNSSSPNVYGSQTYRSTHRNFYDGQF